MGEKSQVEMMVMTLGGSVEPLKKSIGAHKPKQIIFLASHDSVPLSREILSPLDYKPIVHYEITEDPNRMLECYRKARSAVDRARKSGVARERILVDYTGGTKVMTAALILAALGLSYRFHYVGGKERTKNGVGVVVNGKEEFFEEMSPWALFAQEERRQVITLFNQRNFAGAVEIIRNACQRTLPPEIRSYFMMVQPLAQGFLCWDQFNHKDALRYLQESIKKLSDHMESYPEPGFSQLKEAAGEGILFLQKLMVETMGVKHSHRLLLDDLLNNARRRIADGRYDDASARIYRALELFGQLVFHEAVGFPNSDVEPAKVPPGLGEAFIKKYHDPNSGKLKLPLSATFEFLRAIGNPVGLAFFQKMDTMKKIQSSRNKSILAHGIEPVTEKGAHSLFSIVKEFVGSTEFFDFPKLPGSETADAQQEGECR